MRSIGDIIGDIRQKPEAIRVRYMYGCVVVTMLFILGIWFLSITESFRSIATEAPEIKDQAAQAFPKSDDSTDSLSELLEKGKTLDVGGTNQQAEDFFETSLQETKQQPASDGAAPSQAKE